MPKRDIPPLDPKHMYHDTFSIPPEFAKATFRDVILEPAKFQRYFPNVKLPLSYTMEDKAFIYPVHTGMDPYNHSKYWDVFVIYDENLEPVPTVGSTRGIFLHSTGFISHHRVVPGGMGARDDLQYITPLNALRVEKEAMTKDKNGIHVAYSIIDDPDLIQRFDMKWSIIDNAPSSRFVMEIMNKKLRSYFR